MSLKSLIVVDAQNDFFENGALAVPGSNQIIEPLNRVISTAREEGWIIVYTKDYHPENHSSFASTQKKENFSKANKDGVEVTLWPDHCVAGTPGADFNPSVLPPLAQEEIVKKAVTVDKDSYSGFEGGVNGKLYKHLKNLDVEEVYVAGLALDYCVKATALDAQEYGWETNVIVDATQAVGNNIEAMAALDLSGVNLVYSDDITGF